MIEAWLEWLREIRDTPWEPVPLAALIAASVGFALLFIAAATSADGWVMFLDGVNLAFHEVGHPIFSIFGDTLHILGGTLGQLMIPLVVAGAFWKQRQPLGLSIAGVWFFENFLNIARYMADARAQLLPLVGGGEHDWFELFLKWGCLRQDTSIAAKVRVIGWIGMLAAWAWLGWRWWRGRESAQ
ncbi:MAG TPA: hypothetical protein VJ483_04580 [Holophagaceae bacterium]|nr:hypothetical protein [Holophagaceae bacterium]